MTPEQLADEIARIISLADDKFSATISTIQQRLYNKLVAVLKDLELDAEGYILQNTANRSLLHWAEGVFEEVVKSPAYVRAVEESLSVVPDLDSLNEQYFDTVSTRFKPNRNYIKSLQSQVINDINANVLNEGLIVNVKIPLNRILNQNISSGGSYAGFLNQLRTHIIGEDGKEGRLLRYSRTYLTDTLFSYSRSYQQAVTADLKLEFYLFHGTVISKGKGSEGSRGWCLEKKGRYFHHKEIESWANEEWAGKKPGTTESSIFINVGGWNCVDQLIPVHEIIVPAEVIQRATEAGYLKQKATPL
jgi:hypothetical protein